MIAALMLYGLAVSTLVAVATLAAERLARLANQPARLLWIAAIFGTFALIGGRWRSGVTLPVQPSAAAAPVSTPSQAAAGESPRTNAIERSNPATALGSPLAAANGALRSLPVWTPPQHVLVPAGSSLAHLDAPLLAAWAVCSALGLLVLMIAGVRLVRSREQWSAVTVAGVPVFVSRDLGPAVVGLFRYRIVLPVWALELAPVERDLVLAHERQHAATGDPLLLSLATVLVALCPWNAPLWWMARRLRFAIELDCDARVLRQQRDPATYGALLLTVSERTYGQALPIVGMAEPVSLVERRIVALTSRGARFARLRGAAAGSVAAAFVGAACVIPGPAMGSLTVRDARRAVADILTRQPNTATRVPGTPSLTSASVDGGTPATTTTGATKSDVDGVTPPADSGTAIPRQADLFATCQARNFNHDSHSDGTGASQRWAADGQVDGCEFHLKSAGDVQFTHDVTGIDHIGTGGSFEVTTDIHGDVTHLTAHAATGGAVTYALTHNGQPANFDAAGKAWLAQFLVALDRTTAFAIDDRFPILLRDGPDSVVAEVEQMHSGYAQGQYLTRLLRSSALGTNAIRRIGGVVAKMAPDYQTGQVILAVANTYVLDSGARGPFLSAALALRGDHEQADALEAIAMRSKLEPRDVLLVLNAARQMTADHEKDRILMVVARRQPLDAAGERAFAATAESIGEPHERARMLALPHRGGSGGGAHPTGG